MNILSKTSNKRQDKQDNQIKKNILDFNLNFSFAFLLLLWMILSTHRDISPKSVCALLIHV